MNNRRRSDDFSSSIKSFLLEESRRSNLSTSKSNDTLYMTSKSADDTLNKTIELNSSTESINEKTQKSTELFRPSSESSFFTALSNLKFEISRRSSLTSMEKDSLEESNLQETSFKDHVKQTFRRLSQQFQRKPINFTQKLVSILEESFVTSFSDNQKYPDVSLDKIANEFIMLCKFIEDESMPELVDTTLSPKKMSDSFRGIQKMNQQSPKNLFRSIIGKLPSTPKSISSPKISSNNSTPVRDINETNDFVFLEKFCDDLYKQECEEQVCQRDKNLIPPLDLSTTSIYTICEQQMASLEDPSIKEENLEDSMNTGMFYTANESLNDKKIHKYDTNIMEESIKDEILKYRQRCMDFAKQMEEIEKCEEVEEHRKDKETLSNTFLYETINRCIEYKDLLKNKVDKKKKSTIKDTKVAAVSNKSRIPAKTPVKTSANSTTQQSLKPPTLTKAKSLSKLTTTPSMSAKKSTTIEKKSADKLEKVSKSQPKKQLLQVGRQNSGFVTPPGKGSHLQTSSTTKKTITPHKRTGTAIAEKSPNVKTNSLSTLNKNSAKHVLNLTKAMNELDVDEVEGRTTPTSGCSKATSPKGMFFVTPGNDKKLVRKIPRKKMFFTDQESSTLKVQNENVEKKLTPTSSVNKLKYQNVISPIAKYINYKNTNLLKNVNAVKNDMLLTPRKGDPSDNLQIPLSPKIQPEVHDSENKDAAIPQVHYKSANQVQVIKQSPNVFPCRGVLEPINNKVVVKHKGRVKKGEVEMSVVEERQAF